MEVNRDMEFERGTGVAATATMVMDRDSALASLNPVIGGEVEAATRLLDEHTASTETLNMGEIIVRTDIESSLGPFFQLPEYKPHYPEVVVRALGGLCTEYNSAFEPLVETNREWDMDYQYTESGPDSTPINYWVQMDMVGLPQGFLDNVVEFDEDTVRDTLRGRVFEIENSLANYQLLQRIHAEGEETTFFDDRFRSSLDALRDKYGKKIAILATTEQKYDEIKEAEFGKTDEEPLTDDEVKRLSGFDSFMSPDEFMAHLKDSRGDSEFLLYVRSSEPIVKLRKPDATVENPLLEDDAIRKVIKANAITFNVDRPNLPPGSDAKINDTKAYMMPMGMAHRVDSIDEVCSVEQGEPPQITLHSELGRYLIAQGIEPESVQSGRVRFRAKPMQASYGCYGHIAARTESKGDRRKLKIGMKERGPYVIQPEMATPVVINETDGQQYSYIDRNFMRCNGEGWDFMGGFRSLMPLGSSEAQKSRIHGSGALVWAEVIQ